MKIRCHFNTLPLLALLAPQRQRKHRFNDSSPAGTRATSQSEPEGKPPRFPGYVDGPVSLVFTDPRRARRLPSKETADVR